MSVYNHIAAFRQNDNLTSQGRFCSARISAADPNPVCCGREFILLEAFPCDSACSPANSDLTSALITI
jgi:hypothetical protein